MTHNTSTNFNNNRPNRHYDVASQRVALLAAALSSFFTPFMLSAVNIALPAIGKEFGLDNVLLNWVATSFLLAAAISLIPCGRLADIYGRKKLFLTGVVFFTFSTLLVAFSFNTAMLLITRFLQGIGSAMIFSTGTAMITSIFPPKERGKALGILVSCVYVGLSAGPFLGGILTSNLGWRSIFIFPLPLGLLIILLVHSKLKMEWAEAKGEPFDLKGSLIFALAVILLLYGFSRLPATTGFIFTSAGILGIVLFIIWEKQLENPVLNISIFVTNRVFAFSNLAALLHYSATFAITFLISLYLQYIKGFSPQEAGVVLVCQPVFMALVSPFAGRLSDKIEPRIMASIGMGITVAGLLYFSLLHEQTRLMEIIVNLGLLGIGFALFSSPNMNAIMGSVERRHYGVASGMVSSMRILGQMLSMGVAMICFSMVMGKTRIVPENFHLFINTVQILFWLFSSFCLAGLFFSLARGKEEL